MSLSQQHRGKVFVPWFNAREWRSVYDLLCSNSNENYETALAVLKIWKIRTPLLSAGLEGTLIILEALLLRKDNLTESQITQIYSISLMRFLNICAANNEKQGTFNQTITKTDLPKWLVDIRHDIAHDHRLPSKSLLEIGIKKSLNWLVEKYWKVHNETICDYVVVEESSVTRLSEVMNCYVRLKMNWYSEDDISDVDEALMNKINRLVTKKYNKSKTNAEGMLTILEEILKQSFKNNISAKNVETILQMLVNKKVLLSTTWETTSEGCEVILKEFRDSWTRLLNILLENNLLFSLLNLLLDVTGDILMDVCYRKLASLWIKEIAHGLLELRNIKDELDSIKKENPDKLDVTTSKIILKSILSKQNPEYRDCIEFELVNKVEWYTSAALFEDAVLKLPNAYTMYFVERILQLNKRSPEFIDLQKTLLTTFFCSNSNEWAEEMRTINEIKILDVVTPVVAMQIDEPRGICPSYQTNRWRRVEGGWILLDAIKTGDVIANLTISKLSEEQALQLIYIILANSKSVHWVFYHIKEEMKILPLSGVEMVRGISIDIQTLF